MSDDRRLVSLGGGLEVPYPEPRDGAITTIARANTRRDTRPELALRSALHRRGLRFRADYPVRCSCGVSVRVDVAFTRLKVAVFVDGCFWHRCPEHGTIPRRNQGYWLPKLKANVQRDRRVSQALSRDGWMVIRVWEHEPVDDAVTTVEHALALAAQTS